MLNRRTIRIGLATVGRTLKDIAREANLDPFRLYRVVGGVVRPHPREIDALAEALHLDPAELYKPEEVRESA